MSRFLSHRYTRFAALALVALVLMALAPAAQVTASPAEQQSAPGFLVFGGTVVNAPRLNVRDAPSTNGRLIGKIPAGDRVAVVGRSGSWYLIRYPAAPVGLAWVSSSYVQLDGQQAPAPQPTPVQRTTTQPQRPPVAPPPPTTPSLPDIQVEAPNLIDFNNGAFRWQWYGDQGRLNGVDWYTDILLFNKGETMPYRTFVAEPSQVVQDGPFLVWGNEPFRVQCNTEAVARIAVRSNGQFAGWVSGASAPIDVGPKCSVGGGGGGDSSGGGSNGGGGDNGGGDNGGGGGGGGGGSCPPPDIIDCSNPDYSDCDACQ